MNTEKVAINFHATERERLHLDAYVADQGRTRSDVLRELIRKLDAPTDIHVPRKTRRKTVTAS